MIHANLDREFFRYYYDYDNNYFDNVDKYGVISGPNNIIAGGNQGILSRYNLLGGQANGSIYYREDKRFARYGYPSAQFLESILKVYTDYSINHGFNYTPTWITPRGNNFTAESMGSHLFGYSVIDKEWWWYTFKEQLKCMGYDDVDYEGLFEHIKFMIYRLFVKTNDRYGYGAIRDGLYRSSATIYKNMTIDFYILYLFGPFVQYFWNTNFNIVGYDFDHTLSLSSTLNGNHTHEENIDAYFSVLLNGSNYSRNIILGQPTSIIMPIYVDKDISYYDNILDQDDSIFEDHQYINNSFSLATHTFKCTIRNKLGVLNTDKFKFNITKIGNWSFKAGYYDIDGTYTILYDYGIIDNGEHEYSFDPTFLDRQWNSTETPALFLICDSNNSGDTITFNQINNITHQYNYVYGFGRYCTNTMFLV